MFYNFFLFIYLFLFLFFFYTFFFYQHHLPTLHGDKSGMFLKRGYSLIKDW